MGVRGVAVQKLSVGSMGALLALGCAVGPAAAAPPQLPGSPGPAAPSAIGFPLPSAPRGPVPDGAEPCLTTSAAEPVCLGGSLDDGTAYQFAVPARWNRVVLVDLDFADGKLTAPLTAQLLERGYAVGGTTRLVTGWKLRQAIANQAEALARFESAFGPARWSVAAGGSMGGFVAAAAAQTYPGTFDAAVAFCGGLGGVVGQWNQKLDTVFTLKTLLFASTDLPVTGIPADVEGARQGWITSLAQAQTTAEGRARIALAGAIGQLPAWGLAPDWSSTPRPAPHDPAALQEGLYLALSGGPLPYIGQAMGSRRQMETLYGGNPSWNTGVDYAAQLRTAAPEVRRAVESLYRHAGLDLRDDLRRLAAAPRIAADPAAVENLARGLVFTGDLDIPVLTVNNIGDQISTVSQQQAYESVIRARGNASLLRQTYVESAGHCGFTAAEQVAAIDTMAERLGSGRWPATDPRAMNRRAAAADSSGAAGRYLQFSLPRFNRPYFG